MEENVKLTKLAKCAGCGAKVGAGVLAQLLEIERISVPTSLDGGQSLKWEVHGAA